MTWLTDALRSNVEVALFATIMLGYALGQIRLGRTRLNPVLATLIAGLAVGQLGIQVPGAMQRTFFLLFLFAIGFRAGPEFFRSLRSNAAPQIGLTVLFWAGALTITWLIARTLGIDPGVRAGLFAGAVTNSTALGAATMVADSVPGDPAVRERIAANAAAMYALTYPLGAVLVVWCLSTVGPRLMRVDLRESTRALERSMAKSVYGQNPNSLYQEISVRAYRLPAALDGHSAAQIEEMWPADQRAIVSRLRRAGAIIETVTPDMSLREGDVLAVAARAPTLVAPPALLDTEVGDRELLNIAVVPADIVVTNKRTAGISLEKFATEVAARNVFLLRLRRAGRDLPFTASTTIERGDVLSVIGTAPEIGRIAAASGFVEYPAQSTDLLLVAGTIVVGALIGLPSILVGRVAVSLTIPVGVLLAALIVGHLRATQPRFGRVPDAAVSLFHALGLTAFLAAVGLNAAPALIDSIREAGPLLLVAAVVVLVPHMLVILVGYYIVGLHPAILLGVSAGAGTSGPALAAVEAAADSKIPSLSYGFSYAVSNFLNAIAGTVLILAP